MDQVLSPYKGRVHEQLSEEAKAFVRLKRLDLTLEEIARKLKTTRYRVTQVLKEEKLHFKGAKPSGFAAGKSKPKPDEINGYFNYNKFYY